MSEKSSSLQAEIKQQRPFRSQAQEATIGVLRTADLLRTHMAAVIDPFGITLQQYNVLRILRGADPEPLPTLEIRERMIERTPGITRLLDALEKKFLVRRERCAEDRRQVHCWITEEGRELLDRMEHAVNDADEVVLRALSPEQTAVLARLLSAIRASLL